jgi:hypothetical protein
MRASPRGGRLRALLAGPPLSLSAFAFCATALLGERLLAALAGGAEGQALLPTLLFWIGVASAFGLFWLVNALRLAGLVDSPGNQLSALGALATAALGAILAGAELAGGLGEALALALSATCFATAFLLRRPLR